VTPLLSVAGLYATFPGPNGPVNVVDGIDFFVNEAEVVGIVGESGSGKSMTLRAIMRLIAAPGRVEGSVVWDGVELTGLSERRMRAVRGRGIGMIFQEPMTALNPVLPIGLQITECLPRMSASAARRRAVELLDLVGIGGAARRLDDYPHQFSGGMRQRAMIAIALAGQPRLLLADEPTTALDVTIQDQILKLLLRLRDELKMSVVIVTHDLGVVAQTCERVAVMYAGRIAETGPVDAVLARPRHAYTLGLIRSLPDAALARRRLSPIPGAPPVPGTVGKACPFVPRCDFATDICSDHRPWLVAVGPGRSSACTAAGRLPPPRMAA